MANIRKGNNLKSARRWGMGIIVVVAAFAIGKFVIAGPNNEVVPEEFINARSNGAALGANIVGIYDGTVGNLRAIAEKDKEKRYLEALNLTLQGARANREALEKSQQLATELGKMVEASNQFKSQDAKNIVVEAITAEVNLVTHLIAYNGYFNELLGNLQGKFNGTAQQDRVGELIDKMNEEAQIINRLNKKFNDTMAEFDTKYK